MTNLAVVLTTVAAESRAVLDVLDGPRDHREERGTLYEIGVRTGGRSTWTVAVAEIGTGNSTAAVAVERAQAVFRPDAILLVGVATGLGGVDPGDVVVAEAVHDHWQARIHTPSDRLLQYARAVARAGRWPMTRSRLLPTPRVLVKPVVAAPHPRHRCGETVAVEPEGSGFLRGASLNPTAEALIVRGIAGCLTDPLWSPVAARHASTFALAVLDAAGRPFDAALPPTALPPTASAIATGGPGP
jgi:hypothetical protein